MIPSKHPRSSSSPSALSATSPSCGSRKSQRVSRSDSPRGSSNKKHGKEELDKRLRSILCHQLGLPLVCTFHGLNPGELEYLGQESNFSIKTNAYDDVLEKVLKTWKTRREIKLTEQLAMSIDCNSEIPLKAKKEVTLRTPRRQGRPDIVLCSNNDGTIGRPLMVMEVGLTAADWWKKFDQGAKYIKMMQKAGSPLLLGTMTLDKSQEGQDFARLGVFLCVWNKDKEGKNGDVRFSLLWHSTTRNEKEASKAFGCLLRGVCDFSSWIEKVDNEPNKAQHEYFSSNCCKVGDKVLRIYDNRYRKTPRSPLIYLSQECKDIVGEGAKIILTLPTDELSGKDQATSNESSGNDDLNDVWEPSSKRSLQVIVVPYRPGRHDATTPASFLPVIEQLEKLHQERYVHGDIRGFNTVFGEGNDQGYLIDFDFGGEAGKMAYPKGYRKHLGDGTRCGKEGQTIHPWHDWYALGRLIFESHTFFEPKECGQSEWWLRWWLRIRWTILNLELSKLDRDWKYLSHDPTPAMIHELKEFLKRIQETGWTVQPSPKYRDELVKILDPGKPHDATKSRATGSPPAKNESVG